MSIRVRNGNLETLVFASGNNSNSCLGLQDDHNRTKFELVKFWKTKNIVSVAGSETHTVAASCNGNVYSWGHRDCLGYPHSTDAKYSLFPEEITELSGKKIVNLQAGIFFTLALSESGEVYAWGRSRDGECGVIERVFLTPTRVKLPSSAKSIAAKGKHSLALLNSGEVYAFGYNFHGQLGLGFHSIKVAKPSLVTSLAEKCVTMVASGEQHSLFVTSDHEVYSAGYNIYGQLGVGDQQKRVAPTRIDFFKNTPIDKIEAGANFTAILTGSGDIYVCGDNAKGQLGFGDTKIRLVPTKIAAFHGLPMSTIGVGFNHLLAYSIDGRLYGVGENHKGQLGAPTVISTAARIIGSAVPLPKEVKTTVIHFGKVSNIIGTNESTFLIVTRNLFTQKTLFDLLHKKKCVDCGIECFTTLSSLQVQLFQ